MRQARICKYNFNQFICQNALTVTVDNVSEEFIPLNQDGVSPDFLFSFQMYKDIDPRESVINLKGDKYNTKQKQKQSKGI